jgi:hypothetical protein
MVNELQLHLESIHIQVPDCKMNVDMVQGSTSTFCQIDQRVFEYKLSMKVKNAIFWDLMLCGPLKVNQRFGETCRLHFQG